MAATLTALLHGPDQPGLVARVAGWIYERGGNILHADQHRDPHAVTFFQRVEWQPVLATSGQPAAGVKVSPALVRRAGERIDLFLPVPATSEEAAADFSAFAQSLGMQVTVVCSVARPRMAVFVSKADHCFHDLALRWKAGEFSADIVAVVSNHRDLAGVAEAYGLRFVHIPVTAENKATAEVKQLELLQEVQADLVVLARYMQVLSAEFLRKGGRPVINIHHSFLPAFAGGRPYHQAHTRGVKLIGATAHYATADLDEGPIIHQDVVRVTHRHDVDDLIRKGRDLEKMVLAQAVRWHLEGRVLVYGNKTVVFD